MFMPQQYRFTRWLTSRHHLQPQENIQIKLEAIRRVKYDMGEEHLLVQDCYQWASKGQRHQSRYFQKVTVQLEYKTYKGKLYLQMGIKARGA